MRFHSFRYISFIQLDPYQKKWETVDLDPSMCDHKCDGQAKCACGLVYGDHKCACPAGMSGSGTRGDCKGK